MDARTARRRYLAAKAELETLRQNPNATAREFARAVVDAQRARRAYGRAVEREHAALDLELA